jgi:hypothetical protein
MKTFEHKLIIICLYTLSFSAILGIIAVLLLGVMPSTQQTQEWAEKVNSGTYIFSYYLLIYAYLIPILGFWSIHRLFSINKSNYLLSFFGMFFSILGSALPMTSIGISAFTYPTLAQFYLNNGLYIVDIIKAIFNTDTISFLLFSGVYYLLGIILFSIVLWKNDEKILKIASISILIHAILIILPDLIYINLLSWILLLICSILITFYAHKNPVVSNG